MKKFENPVGNRWSPWKRWGDLLLMGLCADLLLGLAAWKFPKESSALIHAPVEVPIAIAGVVLIWAMKKRSAMMDWLGYRNFGTYPPLWVGALFGVLAAWTLFAFYPSAGPLLPLNGATFLDWLVVGSVLGLPTYAWIVSRVFSSADSKWRAGKADEWKAAEAARPTGTLEELDPKALMRWIAHDRPIEDRANDFLEHSLIAKRIVGRLLSQDGEFSQAVIGHLGSGKTSLGHLVLARLSQPDGSRIRFLQLSLWGYRNGEAAIEGILDRLLAGLSKELDSASLRGLPGQYSEAISAGRGFWAVLAKLLRPTDGSLEKILEGAHQLAAAVDLRFVLWIEDLERFASTHGSDRELTTESLGPIRALLHHLDALPSFTVVLATTELSETFDPAKIARFIEVLPVLDRTTTAPILSRVRNSLIANQPNVIPPTQGHQESSGLSMESWADKKTLAIEAGFEKKAPKESSEDSASQTAVTHIENMEAYLYLSSILPFLGSTPRILKQSSRRAQETWEKYPGEIDLDDLILMNLVRTASPAGFAWIQDHFEALRNSRELAIQFGREASPYREALRQLPLSMGMKKALMTVAAAIFSKEALWRKPQGFKARRPVGVGYWDRFLAEPDLSEDDCDQPVLQAIKNNKDDKLCSFLEEQKQAAVVLHFEPLITSDQAISLLPQLLDRWRRSNSHATPDKYGIALKYLARIWTIKNDTTDWIPDLAENHLRTALKGLVPVDLGLAAKIQAEFFGGVSNQQPVAVEQAKRLQCFLRANIWKYFRSRPGELGPALSTADSRSLKALCLGLDPGQTTYSRRWIPVFLAGIRSNPDVLIPQIAHLLCDYNEHVFDEHLGNGWQLNQLHLAKWSQGEIDSLKSLLSAHPSSTEDLAVQELRRRLAAR